MSRWFVVGGAGFIGTNLAKTRPCTVYDLKDGEDALDRDRLIRSMVGYETVVHLAANADIALGAENPEPDFEGIDITRNVCDAARTVGVKRIIYLSGSGVYGRSSGRWPNETSVGLYPISSYGAAKLASEAILHAYEQYGIDVTIFRPANVVGPDQTHGVAYDFINRLRANPHTLKIRGDGKQTKQYVHVNDMIKAIDTAPPGTWNVAPRDTLSVLEIADMVCAQLELSDVTYEIQGGLAWAGDITEVKLASDNLRRQGWKCRSSVQAMTQAIAELVGHEDGDRGSRRGRTLAGVDAR